MFVGKVHHHLFFCLFNLAAGEGLVMKIRGYKTVQTSNSVGVPTYIKLKPMGLAWVCKPMPMKELVQLSFFEFAYVEICTTTRFSLGYVNIALCVTTISLEKLQSKSLNRVQLNVFTFITTI